MYASAASGGFYIEVFEGEKKMTETATLSITLGFIAGILLFALPGIRYQLQRIADALIEISKRIR